VTAPTASAATAVPARRATSRLGVAVAQFRRYPLAVGGALVLALLYVSAAFAPLIAPYPASDGGDLSRAYQEPTVVHWRDPSSGRPTWPFIYATSRRLNTETFEFEFVEDRTAPVPLRFLARRPEAAYRLFGSIPFDVKLVSVDAPARLYLIGADRLGRDLYSRLWYGARSSLTIGLVAMGAAFLVGVVLGGLAGYYGGVADALVMRAGELLQAIPGLYLLITLTSLLPDGLDPTARLYGVVLMIGLTGWMDLSRSVRAQVMSLRDTDFVLAARALGAREARVVTGHLLPSTASYLAVLASITVPGAMLAEAGLSFVGRGVGGDIATWGAMIGEVAAGGIATLNNHPWLLTPGFLVLVTVLAWNLTGDGLRAALDPRRRG
jgi:peptide/nickel transport system permease protein